VLGDGQRNPFRPVSEMDDHELARTTHLGDARRNDHKAMDVRRDLGVLHHRKRRGRHEAMVSDVQGAWPGTCDPDPRALSPFPERADLRHCAGASPAQHNVDMVSASESADATELDVIELLERDHRRIDGLAAQLDAITDADAIRRLYLRIVDDLLLHESIENEVLFPAFREMLGAHRDDRLDTLERRLGEHEELNEMLAEMRGLDPHDFAFVKRGSALLLEVEGHFAREEESVFARMRAELPRQTLLDLGRRARQLLPR
jgi:hypothetical protein